MPLGWIAGATLAVGIGADIIQGENASHQQGIANRADARAGTTFNEQQGFEAQLESLMRDPSSVSKLPGFEFQMQTGSDAIARQMAALGYGGSGKQGMALEQFGQGLASDFYFKQASMLASLSGLQTASSPSQNSAVAAQGTANAGQQWNSTFQDLGSLIGMFGGNYGANTGIPTGNQPWAGSGSTGGWGGAMGPPPG